MFQQPLPYDQTIQDKINHSGGLMAEARIFGCPTKLLVARHLIQSAQCFTELTNPNAVRQSHRPNEHTTCDPINHTTCLHTEKKTQARTHRQKNNQSRNHFLVIHNIQQSRTVFVSIRIQTVLNTTQELCTKCKYD